MSTLKTNIANSLFKQKNQKKKKSTTSRPFFSSNEFRSFYIALPYFD